MAYPTLAELRQAERDDAVREDQARRAESARSSRESKIKQLLERQTRYEALLELFDMIRPYLPRIPEEERPAFDRLFTIFGSSRSAEEISRVGQIAKRLDLVSEELDALTGGHSPRSGRGKRPAA